MSIKLQIVQGIQKIDKLRFYFDFKTREIFDKITFCDYFCKQNDRHGSEHDFILVI